MNADLERAKIESRSFFDLSLFSLNIRQIVLRVGVRGAELESGVVGGFGLRHQSLLLERVREIAVGVRKVWLQLDRSAISVDRQVDQPEATFIQKSTSLD